MPAFNGNYPVPQPRMDWDAIRRQRAGQIGVPPQIREGECTSPPDNGCKNAKAKGYYGRCLDGCPFPDCLEVSWE